MLFGWTVTKSYSLESGGINYKDTIWHQLEKAVKCCNASISEISSKWEAMPITNKNHEILATEKNI